MKLGLVACVAFCLAAGTFLGRYELHTDDTGVEVFLLLLATFAAGCWQPRHAWRWALLIAPFVPGADLFFGHRSFGLIAVAAAVTAFALAGSYIGVLFRWGIAPPHSQADSH